MAVNDSLLDYENCSNQSFYFNLTNDTSEEVLHAYAAILSLIIVIGVVGNSLVLLLVLLDKRLRYRSIIASLSVVLCDLLLTIFYHGVALTSSIMKQWPYATDVEQQTCDSYAIVTSYLLYVRWYAITAIAIDRFCTVYFPFRYPRYSKVVLTVLTILTWAVPFVVVVFNLHISKSTFRPNVPTCFTSCLQGDYKTLCRILNAVCIVFIWLVGTTVPSAVYTWLYCRGRRLRRQPRLGTHNGTYNISASHSVQSFITAQEQKAVITLFLLYLTIVITALPQIIIGLTRYLPNCIFFRIPLEVHLLSSLIFFSSTSLDPIILLRHRDFRIAIKEILCRCRHRPPVQLTRVRTLNGRGRSLHDTTLSQNVNQSNTDTIAPQNSQSLDESSSASPAQTDELYRPRFLIADLELESRYMCMYKLSKTTEV